MTRQQVRHPRAVVRFQGSETEPDLFVRPGPALPNQDWDNAPAPLLVVEVLSPTTWRRDLGAKRKFYLAAGVAEYWVVDPEARDVRVIRPGAEDRVASERLTWAPSAVEPLVVSIPELFPG